MTLYEDVGRNQKLAVEAFHHTHEAMLDLMRPFMTRVEPVRKIVRDLPYADRIPTTRETIDQWFGFTDSLLKEQHDFMLRLVDLVPESKVTPTMVKSAAKAA